MSHKRLLIVATILASIIFVGFVVSVPHTRDVPFELVSEVVVPVPSVAVRDTFKKGVHTITGAVEVPNACTTLAVETSLIGASSTESILVDIALSDEPGICLERVSMLRFAATVKALADLPIVVNVNGVVATTTEL